MREYINRLSRGKFRYDIPDIIQPDDVIIEDVICDTIHNAEFHIQAQDVIKGVVYSDNAKVTVLTPSFAGKDSDIKYVIDARGLSEGDSIEGEFTLVTNAGEKEVLYSFTAVKETVDTSLGKADNLFHFTNLVQVNKEEAVSLYRSDKFKKIFLQGDDVLNNLYDVLYDRENVYESMEEFLIAIKKKSALTFSVDNNIRDYNIDGANEKDSIIIEKNGWGYIKLDVQCEAPFIKMKRGIITSDDFIGDVYELDYIIDDKLLHAGNNYAYIIISSYSHQEVIEITINGKEIVNDSGFDEHREIRTAKSRLTAEYLQFRMKRITKQEWVINTNKILDRVRGLKKSDIIFDVLQAGVNFISGDDYNGSRILENIKDRVLSDVDNHIELYSLYLYVSTLERKDAGYTSDVAQIVTECYEHGYDSWVLLWILFYIDGQSENNKSIKLIRIKDCFNDGCISPVMYLEALNNVSVIVFDKTGTLTKGVFNVTDILPANGFSKEQVLEYAAEAESFSNHPIAKSILAAYEKEIDQSVISDYKEISGYGISVMAGEKKVFAGNTKLMDTECIEYTTCEKAGTKVYLAVDGQYAGCILITDEVKPDSKKAISDLKHIGVEKTVMLTGDDEKIGKSVAEELQLDEYYAQLLPDQKVEKVELLDSKKRPGSKLAFVGDGINDAPVLARADVGIAMGGLGSDAAIEAADVVLMTDEPSKLVDAIEVAKATKQIVMQNIVIALGIKSVFLILGALGIAGMWEAVFGDVGVTIIAVLNAMRILKK